MKHICVLLVVALPIVASGGPNEECALFIDFGGSLDFSHYLDTSDVVSRVDPVPCTVVDAYVGFLSEAPATAYLSCISFGLHCGSGAGFVISFESFLPGGLVEGYPAAVRLTSTECVEAPGLYLGKAAVLVTNTPGDLLIDEHPEFGREVLDCSVPDPVVDAWCVWKHGGIRKPALWGDSGCGPPTAVVPGTWGAVKALYREPRPSN